jgi:hypothetical protein
MAGLKVLWIYCWYSVKWNLFLRGLLICFEENMDLEQHTNNYFFSYFFVWDYNIKMRRVKPQCRYNIKCMYLIGTAGA